MDRMIWGRDGDIITVTYADANPSGIVAKSAMVDLAAPAVTLVSPSDGFFTNTGTATLSAEVVDAEAGVLETDINIVIDTESVGVIGLGTRAKVTDCRRLQGDDDPHRHHWRGAEEVVRGCAGQGGQRA